jgi:ureidoglycolate lyase
MSLDSKDRTTAYLVVVAPTLAGSRGEPGPPSVANVEAFIAHGGQAVTYAAGTWHAPMMVIGERSISFVVMQFMNGNPEDDCEEINLESEGGDRIVLAIRSIDSYFPPLPKL